MAKTIPTSEAFNRFSSLAKRLVNTSKAEVDAKARAWKAQRTLLKKKV